MDNLVIKNEVKNIDKVQEYVDSFCYQNHIGISANINIVLDEIISNIIKFSNSSETIIELSKDGETVSLKISYKGDQVNMFEIGEVNLPNDIETAKIGGLGIHIIKSLVSKVDYRYWEGFNIITAKFLI